MFIVFLAVVIGPVLAGKQIPIEKILGGTSDTVKTPSLIQLLMQPNGTFNDTGPSATDILAAKTSAQRASAASAAATAGARLMAMLV
jgi:hypothetical protein